MREIPKDFIEKYQSEDEEYENEIRRRRGQIGRKMEGELLGTVRKEYQR